MRKRIRRAYLRPYLVTTKPKNAGPLAFTLMEREDGTKVDVKLNRHVSNPGHELAFSDLAGVFAFKNEQEFNKIRRLMEVRSRMLREHLHHNRQIKDVFVHVVLQRSKHFSLVLFWNTGAGRYYFVKRQFDLVSMSKPYVSRDSAMDAHQHRDIFWLDFVRIP
jgi:hypothetical protein